MPSYEDLGEFVALAAALLVLPKLGVVVGAGGAFPDGLRVPKEQSCVVGM